MSYEQSVVEAKKIKKLQEIAIQLDVEFLKTALVDMRSQHSHRDAMAILNPNPFTHNAKQDLDAAKIKQLELYIELAENTKEIIDKEIEVL